MIASEVAHFIWSDAGHFALELFSISAMFAESTEPIPMPVWAIGAMMCWMIPFWPKGTIHTMIIAVVDVVVVAGIFQMIPMVRNDEWSVTSVHWRRRCSIGIGYGLLPMQHILLRFWMLVTHSIFENRF